MLFLLRNIRRKLLTENKLTTYLLYAIGEIILVVVGILIAVSIDDWNESNKQQSIENDFLKALHTEFEANLQDLKRRQNQTDTSIIGMSNLLQLMSKTIDNTFTTTEMDSLLLAAMNEVNWNPSESTLQRLGVLQQEKNAKLLSLLYNWSSTMDMILAAQTKSTNTNNEIIDYIKQHGSLRNLDATGRFLPEGKSTISAGNLHLLTDPVFENIVNDAIVYNRQKKERYRITENKLNVILELTAPQ
jgi:hypothetical protein